MRHPERVGDYFGHIAQAIGRASGYVEPLPDFAAFEKNLQVQDAVVRNIEIIGEAVNHNQPRRSGLHCIASRASMGRDARHVQCRHSCLSRCGFDRCLVNRQNDLPALKEQIDHLLIERQQPTLAQRPDPKVGKKTALARRHAENKQMIPQRQEPDRDRER